MIYQSMKKKQNNDDYSLKQPKRPSNGATFGLFSLKCQHAFAGRR